MASSFPADTLEIIPADIAPHAKLPNELLAEIFRLSIPKIVEIPGSIIDNDLTWVLPCVLKKWRAIVLGIPELWTRVSIKYDTWLYETETLDPQKVTAISNRVLMQSKNALISLKIEASTDETAQWEPMINLIVSQAHRIRYLELRMDGEAFWKILALPSGRFQSLEFLSIFTLDPSEDEMRSVFFQNSPHLRVVELNTEFSWAKMIPHLPWANLEHLSMTEDHDLSSSIAHVILQHCPKLITLEIMLSAYDQTTAAIAPITCLSLKTLLVEICIITIVADFFAPFTLPCLTQLELTYTSEIFDDDEEDWDYSETLVIIAGFQKLTHLKIDIPIPPTYDMTPFLMSIPDILVLRLPLLSHSTLQVLSSGEQLPRLQIFEARIETPSLSSYLSMLNHRADAGCSTRGILFWGTSGHRETYGDDKRIVDKLVGRGLLELRGLKLTHSEMRQFVPSYMIL